jgi:hypothetical protein
MDLNRWGRKQWLWAMGHARQSLSELCLSSNNLRYTDWVVQAQTRSVGVWSLVLVAGWNEVRSCLSLTVHPLCRACSGSLYIPKSLSVITPSHHSLQAIYSRRFPKQLHQHANLSHTVSHTNHKTATNLLHPAAAASPPAGLL